MENKVDIRKLIMDLTILLVSNLGDSISEAIESDNSDIETTRKMLLDTKTIGSDEGRRMAIKDFNKIVKPNTINKGFVNECDLLELVRIFCDQNENFKIELDELNAELGNEELEKESDKEEKSKLMDRYHRIGFIEGYSNLSNFISNGIINCIDNNNNEEKPVI